MRKLDISPAERDLLARSFLFRGASSDSLERALSDPRAALSTFRRGDVIFSGEDFTRAFCLLLSGSVRVHKNTDDGRGLHMSILEPGAFFGAAALFNDCAVFATVLTAQTACRVLFLPEALLLALMRADFAIAENYIRYQSGRILFLNEKISSLAAGPAEKRLAHWLLEHAQPSARGLVCPLSSIRMSSLANSLGIGRASLYRALDALVDSGAVINENREILIPDPAQLRQL